MSLVFALDIRGHSITMLTCFSPILTTHVPIVDFRWHFRYHLTTYLKSTFTFEHYVPPTPDMYLILLIKSSRVVLLCPSCYNIKQKENALLPFQKSNAWFYRHTLFRSNLFLKRIFIFYSHVLWSKRNRLANGCKRDVKWL